MNRSKYNKQLKRIEILVFFKFLNVFSLIWNIWMVIFEESRSVAAVADLLTVNSLQSHSEE